MLNYIKESFHFTNKYIVLATPLILFSLLTSLYLVFSINGSTISLIIAFILFMLMLASFLSGWLNMVKNAVQNDSEEDANSIIKEFMPGVGEYFLPTIGLIINTFIFCTLIMTITFILGTKLIGNTGIAPDIIVKATNSPEALKSFVDSLTPTQLQKLNLWNILIISTSAIMSFLIMFYSPALFFKRKNPFVAFFVQLKDLFSLKFFKNVLLFIIISVSYFFVSLFGAFASINIVVHFIFTLLNFYYLVFITIFIYNYYYNNYVRIGGNIDTSI